MKRSEFEVQKAVFEWAKLKEVERPCLRLLMGSVMGIKMPAQYLNKAKKNGYKNGTPDIQLPVPRGGFCGLWIELKVKPNKVTAAQNWMLLTLESYGNAAYACYGFEPAIMTIERYIDGKIIRPGAKLVWDRSYITNGTPL